MTHDETPCGAPSGLAHLLTREAAAARGTGATEIADTDNVDNSVSRSQLEGPKPLGVG